MSKAQTLKKGETRLFVTEAKSALLKAKTSSQIDMIIYTNTSKSQPTAITYINIKSFCCKISRETSAMRGRGIMKQTGSTANSSANMPQILDQSQASIFRLP